jgi:hypothetical protein
MQALSSVPEEYKTHGYLVISYAVGHAMGIARVFSFVFLQFNMAGGYYREPLGIS